MKRKKIFLSFISIFLFIYLIILNLGVWAQELAQDYPTKKPQKVDTQKVDKIGLEANLKKIRTFIAAAMKQWEVPGVSVGIVESDQVVFKEGFGFRSLDEKLPVTPQTRFILGSTSKAFTTMAMAILVDEGKLAWDTPLMNYIPEFKLMDELATLCITPRDLVTHRTGLPRHDFVWDGSSFSLRELVESLQYLEPSKDFRTTFQYNNLMYITAGYLVGQVSGTSWEDIVQKRIFKPLAMTNSGCTIDEYKSAPEFALSYRKEKGTLKPIPFPSPTDKLRYGPRASGSVNSCAADMCQWLILHLSAGIISDKQIISKENLAQMHTPQITIPQSIEKSEILHQSYGLGWFIDSYRGYFRVHHGGETMGFTSYVTLFPHENLGIVVLANSSSPLPSLVSNYASDILLGLAPIDWNQKIYEEMKKARQPRLEEKRVPDTKPAHKLEDYVGEYKHPGYGLLKIELEGNNLKVLLHGYSSKLEHWHYETFQPVEGEMGGMNFTFLTDAKGKVLSVSVPLEPAVKGIIFSRIN